MVVGVQVHADEGTPRAAISESEVAAYLSRAAAYLSKIRGSPVYRVRMELLERDVALATLAGAYDDAVRGSGRVVFVTGEPGIGKTSLVTRFVRGLGADTRVLFGTCDDLSIPRPLGPIRDLAGSVSAALEGALAAGAAPHDIQTLLLAEVELPPRPTVLVLEDVHWADDATLDAITVLGRRIGSLPALLVLTFRAGEVPPGHPLHAAVGAIRADESVVLELGPLSRRAVASLAGDRAAEVFAATGGNPFYVNELVCAAAPKRIPRTVANAVLGRAARLDSADRRLIELVSVVPGRVRASVLDVVMPDWPAAAEEPERRQLLELDGAYVRFRHELARHAIRSSVPVAACRRLHAEILDALLAADADPADIVHHADAAGAEDVVADYALVAARRAAALESNREAYSQYRRALEFVDRLPADEQAQVLEEVAIAGYTVGRLEEALPAIEAAIAIYARLRDIEALGRSTRILSRLYWFAGDGVPAIEKAREAVEILEPLGETSELARAYSAVSQLAMLSEDGEQSMLWGDRAIQLATKLGDEATLAHALVNIGTSRNQLDPDDNSALVEAYRIADAAGNWEEGARSLANLAFTLLYWGRPEQALQYAEQGLAYSEEHDLQNFVSYTSMTIAWLRLRAGDWREAEQMTGREIGWGSTVPQLLARTVLAELAVRRGDEDARELLADLAVQADRAGDLQRMTPVLELATESALTSGGPMPVERIESLLTAIRRAGDRARLGPPPRGGLGGGGRHRGRARPCRCDALRGHGPSRLAGRRRQLRRDRLALRPRTDALAPRRGGSPGRVDRDRAKPRRCTSDEAGCSAHARPRPPRPAWAARGDALQPGGIDHPPARGARAARRGADERRDRRSARPVAANGRAPRCRRPGEARGDDAARGRTARFRASPGGELRLSS